MDPVITIAYYSSVQVFHPTDRKPTGGSRQGFKGWCGGWKRSGSRRAPIGTLGIVKSTMPQSGLFNPGVLLFLTGELTPLHV